MQNLNCFLELLVAFCSLEIAAAVICLPAGIFLLTGSWEVSIFLIKNNSTVKLFPGFKVNHVLFTYIYKMIWRLKSFAVKYIVREESHMKEACVRDNCGWLIQATETAEVSVSVLKVRKLHIIAFCFCFAP